MSKRKEQLRGPWQSIQSAIWLIGLAILFIKGWWWPGILILIAISMITQAVIQIAVPDAVEEEIEEVKAPAKVEAPQPAVVEPPQPAEPEHPTHLLPSECPQCNAPIRGHEVEWSGPQSADCPYCGANLPLKSA